MARLLAHAPRHFAKKSALNRCRRRGPAAATLAQRATRARAASPAAGWSSRALAPLEALELDPVRLDRGIAQTPFLVGLIVLEIAFEPFDVAVALEGQKVRCHAVEEKAVVADDDGATGEVFQRRLQRR